MAYDVETAATELLALAGSENTSGAIITAILAEHENCFDASDICEVCTYLDEELIEDLLVTLAGNSSLSPALQDQVLSQAFKWQGRHFAVLATFATNPNVSDSMKVATLDPTLISDGMDTEEELEDYLGYFRNNPRYTKDEIKEFIKSCNEMYEMPEGWSK